MNTAEFQTYPFSSLNQYLQSVERALIVQSLEEMHWNRTRAAKDLGITFRAFRYRLHKLGIEDNGAAVTQKLPPGFHSIWPKLRETVFKIHGRKCALCGAKARHGVMLHVDHIKPVNHYPELALDLTNLQVLCDTCNTQKGDSID